MLLPPYVPLSTIEGIPDLINSSLASIALVKPGGVAITRGTSTPSLFILITSAKAVGEFPITTILGDFKPILIEAAVLVIPSF